MGKNNETEKSAKRQPKVVGQSIEFDASDNPSDGDYETLKKLMVAMKQASETNKQSES